MEILFMGLVKTASHFQAFIFGAGPLGKTSRPSKENGLIQPVTGIASIVKIGNSLQFNTVKIGMDWMTLCNPIWTFKFDQEWHKKRAVDPQKECGFQDH